jgi:uncharacterized protein YbjT (DUF2867 family)
MSGEVERILITGANGHVGRQLIEALAESHVGGAAPGVRALVRSEKAADSIRALAVSPAPEVVICDYHDVDAVTDAVAGCREVVHLVGIIKETKSASYESAHEATCEVLAAAAATAGVQRIVYLSIFGSAPEADNACLASKGRAEQILLRGSVSTTVLRVPMVIGPEDFASASLRGQARAKLVPMIGGGATLQQPIDCRDVVAAIGAALEQPSREVLTLDLGGPERLTHVALVRRAARLYDNKPIVLPLPDRLSRIFASLCEALLANPPITSAMLAVLQHDDRIDEATSCKKLGITLRPLDDTLRNYVGPESLPA